MQSMRLSSIYSSMLMIMMMMMMILNDNDVLVMLREYDRVSVRARRHWAAARHASIDTPT